MIFRELFKEFYEESEIQKFEIFDYEKHDVQKSNIYEGNFYNEEWKLIPTFNYECSNYGRIRNIKTKKLKQLKFNMYGMQVILWKNSRGFTFTMSNLVGTLFIRKLKKNEHFIYIDRNIRNNYYKNLKVERKIK